MAYKCREEIVGKRFLSISGFSGNQNNNKLKQPSKINEWGWRAGVIRASTHKDNNHAELQVLVEYDDVEWHRREWISIYKEGLFHLFLVEQALVWGERLDPFSRTPTTALWPALTFLPLVASVEIPSHLQPIEFLLDHELAFKEYRDLKPFKEWDSTLAGVREYPELRLAAKRWTEQQDGQRILLTTPSVLVGYRVEVYRAEGTTQWYTAVIVGYNEATRDLTVTDDTVLEVHNEDPTLVQMRLIDDGVVESIMRGENVGITPRRSRSAVLQAHQQQSRIVRFGGQQSVSRKLRTGKLTSAGEVIPNSPESDKALKVTRKRKTSETRNNYQKEDLENKQRRKAPPSTSTNTALCNNRPINKKKVLEEANNSKLRDNNVVLCSRRENCGSRDDEEEDTQSNGTRFVDDEEEGDDVDEDLDEIEQEEEHLADDEEEELTKDSSVIVDDEKNQQETINLNCDDVNDGVQQLVHIIVNNNKKKIPITSNSISSSCGGDDVQNQQENPTGGNESMPANSDETLLSEEDDCVIVSAPSAQQYEPKQQQQQRRRPIQSLQPSPHRHPFNHHHSISINHSRLVEERDDDVVPLLSSSSPYRMDLSQDVGTQLRFLPDDRCSDSGVSSLRSTSSGDERSGSRSSALSSSDDSHTTTPTTTANNLLQQPSSQVVNSVQQQQRTAPATEGAVRVWRDPNLLLESEPHVRHIHSVQHQTLLMSHPQTAATSASGGGGTNSASGATVPSSSGQQQQPLYTPIPPPHTTLMTPHPHTLPHHLPPPNIYSPHHLADIMWKHQRYGPLPVTAAAHILSQQSVAAAAAAMVGGPQSHGEDLVTLEQRERYPGLMQERERHHDRLIRERTMELEKQQKEKERLERERQERDKIEREKLEREREEKERQEKQLNSHFEKSLRAAQQKREQWNPIGSRPPQPRTSSLSEDDRKRIVVEQEHHHQREQARHMSVRPDGRDHRPYYPVQRPPSVPSKQSEYPQPPAAHSRITTTTKSGTSSGDKLVTVQQQQQHAQLQNKELNHLYGYSTVCHPNAYYEPKNKQQDHHSKPSSGSVTKQIDRDLPNPPPLVSNSVIVKNDGKNSGGSAHSPSPKLRNDLMGHYGGPPPQPKGAMYEYRSPTQSPHQQQQSTHHRTSARQSPHPEIRYHSGSRTEQALIYPTNTKSYPFLVNSSTNQSNHTTTKPRKVNSPIQQHHMYGKPSSGVVSVVSNPLQLTKPPPLSVTASPSPYQPVVSQYVPPQVVSGTMMTCPPPAHSSRTTTPNYERIYAPGVKLPLQHGTSPPTAASAPLPVSRQHYTIPSPVAVQTQPLDLGTNKYESASSPKRKATSASCGAVANPVCLEVKKRRTEPPPTHTMYNQMIGHHHQMQQPQLARVSEPSALIPSAATTITTVVNTAAYRTSQVLNDNLTDVTVTTVSVVPQQQQCAVTPAIVQQQTVTIADESPVKSYSNSSGSVVNDSDKSNSPVPNKIVNNSGSSTHTVRHLKKAWLQRHTGEDLEDQTGVIGSGNCVTLPIIKTTVNNGSATNCATVTTTIASDSSNASVNKESPVNSIVSVGTMAVNSINKSKCFGKSVNKKTQISTQTNSKEMNGVNNEKVSGSSSGGTNVTGDDSSSSDQERGGRKSPPKRKPPKVKRRKGGGGAAQTKKPVEEKRRKSSNNSNNNQQLASESGSDSEKESGSEKDSDSGCSSTTLSMNNKKNATTNASSTSSTTTTTTTATTTTNNSQSGGNQTASVQVKEPRKRGRRPKSSKNDKGEEPRNKKAKENNDTSVPQRDPFRKPPVGQLKKTGESFLQDGPCFEVAPKLAKCRECRWTPNQRSKNMPNIFCRFYAFRRLRYTKNGQLAIAGFSDPHKDALEDDLKLWLPDAETPPTDLDLETSRFLLKQVGDHFCDLLVQEKDAFDEHMSDDKTIAWKRVVQGVREMCDVCETTLFNFHWACRKCGFVVCLDCYKSRKNGTIKIWGESSKDRDEFSWLLCTNRQAHEQEKLMLTQIIAGDSLVKLGRMVHEMRDLWNIEQYCGCLDSKDTMKTNNFAIKELIKNIVLDKVNGIKKEMKQETPDNDETKNNNTKCNGNNVVINKSEETKTSPLSWLADVALSNEDNNKKQPQQQHEESSSDSEDGNYSTLRELLIRPSHKPNGSRAGSPTTQQNKTNNNKCKQQSTKCVNDPTLDDVISSVIEDSVPKQQQDVTATEPKSELKHFVRRYNWQTRGRQTIPIRIMTLTESKILYPNVPHTWLCDGKLLRLSDPSHKENYKIFRDQWKRGQPVIVSDVTKLLNKDLWSPDAFARDFGDVKNDLVNCMTGNLVPNQPMRKFWEGFDHFAKRLKDDRGNPMLLKLKDWPPGEDFAEMLPTRFNDLMKVLPLGEYTHRSGRLNLASRLPDCFVRPDLGPKMYNAYGSALHPSKGTTNLHLDISDAVNVMVYVGIPKDGSDNCSEEEHVKEAFRAIDEAGCDILTRRRVRDKGELPGALWHIYNARDADKIRDLLNKVVVEKGGRLEPHHDPIHDQSCYLDGPLRERLYKEYGVEGYAIVQCLGDAVFIPAGAPHQVRNLHNCIKVAEDFVSPENVSHCFHLTQEFRDLTSTHSNHEDKLQIKNIIYHAVKDSLASLSAIVNKQIKKCEMDSNAIINAACVDSKQQQQQSVVVLQQQQEETSEKCEVKIECGELAPSTDNCSSNGGGSVQQGGASGAGSGDKDKSNDEEGDEDDDDDSNEN